MRIVGGRFRGRKLAEVGAGDAAAHLRPTPDRVREALFNMLGSGRFGQVLEGARVLDLFAGTGALGFEALSRGAAHVTFVENGAAGRALTRENIDKLQAMGTTRLFRRDATRLGDNRGALFTLVFMDPPYGQGLGAQALGSATKGGWLAPDALVIWEEAAPQPAPTGFVIEDQRKYGASHITLMRRKPASEMDSSA